MRHTRLQEVPGTQGIRLHLADDALKVWGDVQAATGEADAPIPYWGFAWGGGLAIVRYLGEHPDVVRGRRVLDLAAGLGAVRHRRHAGRRRSRPRLSILIRSLAAAIGLNAKANRVRLDIIRDDILDDEPPDADVILAGDCWYEEQFAARVSAWLHRAHAAGIDVLIGDPGRRYLAHEGLRELATYDVRTTTDLEDLGRTRASVYTFEQVGSAQLGRHGE